MDFFNDTNTLANVGTITISGNTLTITSTGAVNLPIGTTAQRPTAGASTGSLRYNSTISSLEFYTGAAWSTFGAAISLGGLSDTTISSPSTGQLLVYNGTSWSNSNNINGNLTAKHILLGDSLTNANIANVYVPGTISGPLADRPITFIDTSAVMKIVRVGGNPAIELQEWDAGITTRLGYYDFVSVSGQLQIRDRSNDATTLTMMTLDKVTGNAVITGSVTGSNLSGTNTGDQTITLTGDVTGTGTGSFVATLAASGVTAGTYSGNIVVDSKGRVTSASQLTATDVATALGYVPAAPNTAISTKTSNYTLTLTDDVILANGKITLTIPAAATAGAGFEYVIKRINSGGNGQAPNIVVNGGGTIDGNTSIQLTSQYTSINLVSDGTTWWII